MKKKEKRLYFLQDATGGESTICVPLIKIESSTVVVIVFFVIQH